MFKKIIGFVIITMLLLGFGVNHRGSSLGTSKPDYNIPSLTNYNYWVFNIRTETHNNTKLIIYNFPFAEKSKIVYIY